MVFKASILLLALIWNAEFARATSVEIELNDSLSKKDWPGVVLLLQPLQGQSFEHDLILAKALLSLERRQEVLKLMDELYANHKDERTQKLFNLAGTLFFNQETSTLYYEAVQLISIGKFTEAKEHLDQALIKEPGHFLVLLRLVQVEILLGLKDAARNHLRLAESRTPGSFELKLFAAKLDLDAFDASAEDPVDFTKTWMNSKSVFLENELGASLWAEALKREKKLNELSALGQKILKEHSNWSYVLAWYYKNGEGNPVSLAAYKSQVEKNLKDRPAFEARLEKEMKRTQYFWVGYETFETVSALLNQVQSTGAGRTN